MNNVPDDWNCWYVKCQRCGRRYHASEGGCVCLDELNPCQCERRNWGWCGSDDEIVCRSCHTGPRVDGRKRVTTQRAVKDYPGIARGDMYRRVVVFSYFPGGARTIQVYRSKVKQ